MIPFTAPTISVATLAHILSHESSHCTIALSCGRLLAFLLARHPDDAAGGGGADRETGVRREVGTSALPQPDAEPSRRARLSAEPSGGPPSDFLTSPIATGRELPLSLSTAECQRRGATPTPRLGLDVTRGHMRAR
jgi:hypothetical protein